MMRMMWKGRGSLLMIELGLYRAFELDKRLQHEIAVTAHGSANTRYTEGARRKTNACPHTMTPVSYETDE